MKNKKIIKKLISVRFIVILLAIYVLYIVFARSDFHRQLFGESVYYHFDIKRHELVKAIDRFKLLNPQYIVPDLPEYVMFSHAKYDIKDVYSPIFFFYPQEKLIVASYIWGGYEQDDMAMMDIHGLIDPTDSNDKERGRGISLFGCTSKPEYVILFEERIINPLRKQIEEDKKRK